MAMACGHIKCDKTKIATTMMGYKIDIFLVSISSLSLFGTESRDDITTEANADENDKEYQVCATLKTRINNALA